MFKMRFTLVRSMMLALLVAGSTVFGTTLAFAANTADSPALPTLGWIENAYLIDADFPLQAKLDTGANTSSLDARIIKAFRQYNKRWIRFAVRNPESGEETILVRERQRTIGIVQHVGGSETRPTVNVDICIAGHRHSIEVSLVDRENFKYPLLLGRRALTDIAVIHPGKRFMGEAVCPEQVSTSDQQPRPGQQESADEQDDPEDTVDEFEATGEDERIDQGLRSR